MCILELGVGTGGKQDMFAVKGKGRNVGTLLEMCKESNSDRLGEGNK